MKNLICKVIFKHWYLRYKIIPNELIWKVWHSIAQVCTANINVDFLYFIHLLQISRVTNVPECEVHSSVVRNYKGATHVTCNQTKGGTRALFGVARFPRCYLLYGYTLIQIIPLWKHVFQIMDKSVMVEGRIPDCVCTCKSVWPAREDQQIPVL